MEILKRSKCKALCKDAGLSCPPCPEGVSTDHAKDADVYYEMAVKQGLTPRRFIAGYSAVVIWRGSNPTKGNPPDALPFGEGA